MPAALTYPGVYVEEIPSGVRTITGVATSIAAFVDCFKRGPMDEAVQVTCFADFERQFGGLDRRSEASYAIRQFFINGGTLAWVVRVARSGTATTDRPRKAAATLLTDAAGGNALEITAVSEGAWGNQLRVMVEHTGASPKESFDLTVLEVQEVEGKVAIAQRESFRGLSMKSGDPRYAGSVLDASGLVRVASSGTGRPAASGTVSGPLGSSIGEAPAGQPMRVQVTFTDGTEVSTLVAVLGTKAILGPEAAAERLEAAIRAANPKDRAWAQTTVRAVNQRLQIVAGPSRPHARVTFDAAPAPADGLLPKDDTTYKALKLDSGSATSNVAFYKLGYEGVAVDAQGAGNDAQGRDGLLPDDQALLGSRAADPPTGIYALERADVVNIVCMPRIAKFDGDGPFERAQVDRVIAAAAAYCEERRALFIVDTPSDISSVSSIKEWLNEKSTIRHKNLVLYYPRIEVADPFDEYRPRSFGASGTVAGLYARTDVARGVWKAPAGTDATLRGAKRLGISLTDAENGLLNPLAINCLRSFPVYGNLVWGARTLEGADDMASEWKYVPVRRLALYLEESLYRGLKWVVFEPNAEPLWAQIRLNVGAFMHDLYRQGAFAGKSSRDAYYVKCDGETTIQNDIDRGIVNILVGFAPLKPAEFVVIKLQQMAGQVQV